MLDTIIQIGKSLKDNIKNHRYIVSLNDEEKEKTIFINLPITENFNFEFKKISLINDENSINNKLCYLKYKTSDSDGMVKYIFGDIYYVFNKGKENGYYRMQSNRSKAFNKSSFTRGDVDANDLIKISPLLGTFRNKFKEDIIKIENIIKYITFIKYNLELNKPVNDILLQDENELRKETAKLLFKQLKPKEKKELFNNIEIKLNDLESDKSVIDKLLNNNKFNVFLHFDFNGKQWYELEEIIQLINKKLLKEFFEEKEGNNYVIKKYIYKTLSSPEKDFQFPDFNPKNSYKNRIFTEEEMINLFYAIDYSMTALIKIPKTDIKVIVLPCGDNLSSEDYLDFLNIKNNYNVIYSKEEEIKSKDETPDTENIDSLFKDILNNKNEKIIKFDFIFSKKGKIPNPDVDIIEISGIEKSFISIISKRINEIANELSSIKINELKKENIKYFNINSSFFKLFEEKSEKGKSLIPNNYENHLYKVLPLIYTGSYYRDNILLKIFIQNTQKNIRSGFSNYNNLKYDFIFLTLIQNTKEKGENLMEIKNSPSYNLGLKIGSLAAPLRRKIKSFEKNYVGNLTRRISSINDIIKFIVFIEEKLTIHNVFYKNLKITAGDLDADIKNFTGRYDKDECAFGFFESYYSKSDFDADQTSEIENSENYIELEYDDKTENENHEN